MSLDNVSNSLLSKLVKPEIPSRSLWLKPTRIYLDGIQQASVSVTVTSNAVVYTVVRKTLM